MSNESLPIVAAMTLLNSVPLKTRITKTKMTIPFGAITYFAKTEAVER
jgi:hypothetical protein